MPEAVLICSLTLEELERRLAEGEPREERAEAQA